MGQVEKRTCINQHSRRAVVYKLMSDYLSCINIIQWRIPGPVCLWQLLAVDDLVGNLQTPLININRCIRWINVWEKKIANIYSKPTMSLKWTGFFFFSENCSITGIAMKEFFIWINTSHAPLFVSSIFWLRWEQCSSFSLSIFNIEYTYLVLEINCFDDELRGIKLVLKYKRIGETNQPDIIFIFLGFSFPANGLQSYCFDSFISHSSYDSIECSHFDHIAHIFE